MNTTEELTMRPPLVASLFKALEKGGATDYHVEQLRDLNLLKELISVIEGKSTILIERPVMDCSQDVAEKDGGKIVSFNRQGKLFWDKELMETSLFQTERQKEGKKVTLKFALEVMRGLGLKPFNDCPIPFLLKRQYLIPLSWKSEPSKHKRILFPGTLYEWVGNEPTCMSLGHPGYWTMNGIYHDLGPDDYIAYIPKGV